MVAIAETLSDLHEGEARDLLGNVHCYLPSQGHLAGPPLASERFHGNIEILGRDPLDRRDVRRADREMFDVVAQCVVRELIGDAAVRQRGEGGEDLAVGRLERAAAEVGGHLRPAGAHGAALAVGALDPDGEVGAQVELVDEGMGLDGQAEPVARLTLFGGRLGRARLGGDGRLDGGRRGAEGREARAQALLGAQLSLERQGEGDDVPEVVVPGAP